MYSYITTFKLPVINCSERGLLSLGGWMNQPLEDVLNKINPNQKSIMDCKDHFEALNVATINYNNSKKLFEKARRYRYDYR